ncbi:DUF1450 domain-containing protein [Aneurinibacillus sp. BA2021]|nr:DUF1450 domain-containing protein [Aneurinibacillus sp. BA2021]
MKYVAKFCPNNCQEEIRSVKEQLARMPDMEIVDDFCVLYCGQCLVQPFTLINGKSIAADSGEELLGKISAHIAAETA